MILFYYIIYNKSLLELDVQVLFNDTIFHNIHYGRLSAAHEEVDI